MGRHLEAPHGSIPKHEDLRKENEITVPDWLIRLALLGGPHLTVHAIALGSYQNVCSKRLLQSPTTVVENHPWQCSLIARAQGIAWCIC